MTEQTEGNGSNIEAQNVVKGFVDLVYAGLNDAVVYAGDQASVDALNAISAKQKAAFELAVLLTAHQEAGLEGVFDEAVAAAIAATVAKNVHVAKSPLGFTVKALLGLAAGEAAKIPLSNTETGQAAKEWAEKWWGEALAQPTNFSEPASEAAFDQGVSDWVDKWGEALIEQPLTIKGVRVIDISY